MAKKTNASKEVISRFSSAPFVTKEPLDIVIIGAGGISSWTALFLSRLQHNLYIYDHDTFEVHNLAGQFVRQQDIDKNKAEVMKDLISEFSPYTNVSCFGKFDEESMIAPIMICGPDNMAVRKLAFERWKEQEDKQIFIDGRLQAELGYVFTVTPGREEMYEATLFDDKEVEEPICSFKQTTHCAGLIGSLITSNFVNWLANDLTKDDLREIPFKIEFVTPLMYFNSKT